MPNIYNMVPQNNNKLYINTHTHTNPTSICSILFKHTFLNARDLNEISIHFNSHPQFCAWNHCILPAFLQTSLVRRSLHIKLFSVSFFESCFSLHLRLCFFHILTPYMTYMSLFSMKTRQGFLTTHRNLPQITSLEKEYLNLYPSSCAFAKKHPSMGTIFIE